MIIDPFGSTRALRRSRLDSHLPTPMAGEAALLFLGVSISALFTESQNVSGCSFGRYGYRPLDCLSFNSDE
jgi:hypothetical protein